MPPRPLAKHSNFRAISIHTAKCDRCDRHNKDTMYRCVDCGEQICTPCIKSPISDGQHVLDESSDITPAAPIVRSNVNKKKRARESEVMDQQQSRKMPPRGSAASRNVVNSKKGSVDGKQTDKLNRKKRRPTLTNEDGTESEFDVQIAPRSKPQHKAQDVPAESESDLEFVPRPMKKRQRVSLPDRCTVPGNIHHIQAGPYSVPFCPSTAPQASTNLASPEPRGFRHIRDQSRFKRSDSPSPSDIEDPCSRPAGRTSRPSTTRHGFLTPPAQSSPSTSRKAKFHRRSRSDSHPHPPTEDDLEAAGILTTLSSSSASRSPNGSGGSDIYQRQEEHKVLNFLEPKLAASRLTYSDSVSTGFHRSASTEAWKRDHLEYVVSKIS